MRGGGRGFGHMRGHYLRGRGGSGGWHGGAFYERWPVYVEPYPGCYEGLDPECIGGDEGSSMGQIHPREQKIHLFGNVFVTVRRSDDGLWSAETEIPTNYGGPVRITAAVHERVILNMVRRMTRGELARAIREARRSGATEVAGGVFDDIGKAFSTAVNTVSDAVSSVAKTKVFQDVAKGVSDFAKNPIVQGAMGVLPGGGLINQGLQQTSHAASLLAKSKSGDQAAREGIQGIANLAAAGNPKAQANMNLLNDLNRNPLKYLPGAGPTTVSGAVPMQLDLETLRAYAQPASSLGPDAMARGVNLLARARGGDTGASAALAGIAQRASIGDPRAREIAGMLRGIAQNGGAPGDISAGADMRFPMPRPVYDPQYNAMVQHYREHPPVIHMHAGADGVFRPVRRKPRRVMPHALRSHSINYGLPLRVR